MQFKDFNHVKDFIERGLLSYAGILLHLPCVVEKANVEQAVKLVPGQWIDKFISDVNSFDPTKQWRNTEHPTGLPPANYLQGMELLRRQFEIQTTDAESYTGSGDALQHE